MRRDGMLLLVLLSTGMAGPALAGPFGPPAPAARAGQVSQEIGYFWSQADLEPDSGDFDAGRLRQHQIYLQAGYGLAGNAEAYFRVGGADLELSEAFAVDGSDLEDDFQPFAAAGLRGLLYDGEVFDLGAFLQGSYHFPYKDSRRAEVAGVPVRESLELEHFWEVDLGLALQADLGVLSLYAGPFLYYSQGRLKAESSALGLEETNSTHYEEDGNLGAVAGISLPLPGALSLNLEGQYKSRLSGGGAVAYLRFAR